MVSPQTFDLMFDDLPIGSIGCCREVFFKRGPRLYIASASNERLTEAAIGADRGVSLGQSRLVGLDRALGITFLSAFPVQLAEIEIDQPALSTCLEKAAKQNFALGEFASCELVAEPFVLMAHEHGVQRR